MSHHVSILSKNGGHCQPLDVSYSIHCIPYETHGVELLCMVLYYISGVPLTHGPYRHGVLRLLPSSIHHGYILSKSEGHCQPLENPIGGTVSLVSSLRTSQVIHSPASLDHFTLITFIRWFFETHKYEYNYTLSHTTAHIIL